MSQKRLSQSMTGSSWGDLVSPVSPAAFSDEDSEIWVKHWRAILAKGRLDFRSPYPWTNCPTDLIDSRIVELDAETSVEDACDVFISTAFMPVPILNHMTETALRRHFMSCRQVEDTHRRCSLLWIVRCRSHRLPRTVSLKKGEFSDVNAFLTLAATRHTLLPDDLRGNPRIDNIVTAARAGRVPVHLVSSEYP